MSPSWILKGRQLVLAMAPSTRVVNNADSLSGSSVVHRTIESMALLCPMLNVLATEKQDVYRRLKGIFLTSLFFLKCISFPDIYHVFLFVSFISLHYYIFESSLCSYLSTFPNYLYSSWLHVHTISLYFLTSFHSLEFLYSSFCLHIQIFALHNLSPLLTFHLSSPTIFSISMLLYLTYFFTFTLYLFPSPSLYIFTFCFSSHHLTI